MKLHAWDTTVNDKTIRALTRDRAGVRLKKQVIVHAENAIVQYNQWKYAGIVSTTNVPIDDVDYIRRLHATIRRQGIAVVRMPELHRKFFVFDVQLDVADLRVYSADKELTRFKEIRKQMELGVQGDQWLGEGEKLVGEVEITSEADAKRMGIDDFHTLQWGGLWISVVRVSEREETFRRRMERELPKKLSEVTDRLGIKLISLRVDEVKIRPHDTSESLTAPVGAAHVSYDNTDQNVTSKSIDQRENADASQNDASGKSTESAHTLYDRIIAYCKNHRVIAPLIVIGVVLVAIATIATPLVDLLSN